MRHAFTERIFDVLEEEFGQLADEVFRHSELLQYINLKTRAAASGSKSRGAFANNYAIYVLVENYVNNGYHQANFYKEYGGAQYAQLLKRQRELAFGAKLQNHALNGRLNDEFRKFFPEAEYLPVIRSPITNRYWINENLLNVTTLAGTSNIAVAILKIIDAYVEARKDAFEGFIKDCIKIQDVDKASSETYKTFIQDLLRPNVDAHIFEIVSYSILKEYYKEQQIFWGFSMDTVHTENLKLYKTGRTNANDGGIDFVMRPIGRFFQVTETLDVRKYFLDIDKIQHFPLTFVVKSSLSSDDILLAFQEQAQKHFVVSAVINAYMQAIEEVINIPRLLQMLDDIVSRSSVAPVLDEIVLQSKVEFNYTDMLPAEAIP